MNDIWHSLVANLAIVAWVIVGWSKVREQVVRFGERTETAAFGLWMGGGAALAMTLGFRLEPGMIFDLRAAPLAMAGFFGGPLAALVAVVPCLLFRVWVGGAGVLVGCLTVTTVTGFATLQQLLVRGTKARQDMLLLAAGCALASLMSFFALPSALVTPSLVAVGFPTALLNLAGIWFAGLLVLREERWRERAASNRLHQAIFEALPDSLNIKDPDGRFMAANPATARLMRTGTADNLIGRTDFDFYPPETASTFRAEELAILEQGSPSTIEQEARFPDGSQLWLSTLKTPLRDANGRLLGLITHNRDITRQKSLSLELQTARRQLDAALEHMVDGLVMYDREGRILVANRNLHALFPGTADLQVPGRSLREILEAGIDRGEHRPPDGMNREDWIAAVIAGARAGGDRVLHLAKGRIVAARDRPTMDGGFLTVFSDVTAEKMREQDLVDRAECDWLTGLANRSAFHSRLAELHREASVSDGQFSVAVIDLDRFKEVNDTFGHEAGDRLLVVVGERLQATCRHGDLVARMGGDEFALLVEGEYVGTGMPKLAQRILDHVARPLQFGSVTLLPSCSIGFTTYAEDPGEPAALLAHADQALYAAKRTGRRGWAAYSGSADRLFAG